MTTLPIVVVVVAAVWAAYLLVITVIDNAWQRQHVLHLQTRDWEEKVAAMRRLHDEEGEA